MHTRPSPGRRISRGVRWVAVFGLVLQLLAAASPALAEGTIDKVGTACKAAVPDIWDWVDAQGAVPPALAGNWTVTQGSIGDTRIVKDDLRVESVLEDDTVLVEEIRRKDAVVYLSLTGFDEATGIFVSLWAGAETCWQLRGSFRAGEGGRTASREMSSPDCPSPDCQVKLDYARTAAGTRPTGCTKSGEPCIVITNCCSGKCVIPEGAKTGKCP